MDTTALLQRLIKGFVSFQIMFSFSGFVLCLLGKLLVYTIERFESIVFVWFVVDKFLLTHSERSGSKTSGPAPGARRVDSAPSQDFVPNL